MYLLDRMQSLVAGLIPKSEREEIGDVLAKVKLSRLKCKYPELEGHGDYYAVLADQLLVQGQTHPLHIDRDFNVIGTSEDLYHAMRRAYEPGQLVRCIFV